MRRALTIGIWAISSLSLLAAGVLVTAFFFMATGTDPSDMIANGIQPWSDALWASAGFVGLVIATILALVLWHTARLRMVGLILTLIDAGVVAWTCAKVYADYF